MNDELVRAKASLEHAVTEVIRLVPSAVAMLDEDLHVINHNYEFARMFGVPNTDGDAPAFDISALYECCARMKLNGHGHSTLDEMQTPSGRLADIRMNMMDGGGIMVSATDITDHKRKEQMLDTLASTDPLTRALNRRGFEIAVSRLREIRHLKDKSWVFGLIILDLDYFKDINDTYGHAIGDRVLEKVAETLRQALRDDDLVVRLGGEEFAVLLPSATAAVTKRIGERLSNMIRAIEVPVSKGSKELVKVTASFGATVGGEGRHKSVDLADAMALADEAMYEAKDAGRDRMIFKTFERDPEN